MKSLKAFPERFFILLILFSGLFHSCKKESTVPIQPSYNYFPVERGRWVEYLVDSVYHGENDNNNDDSVYAFQFQLREEIDSTFVNGQGQESQIIKRFSRNHSGEDWTIVGVWTQTLTLTGAYRTEDNIPFQKLAFPISTEISWNGNAANTRAEEMYFYDSFHEPHGIGSHQFDSTLSVIQIDEENYIERIYGVEKYAAGVGLIFKQRDDLGKRNGIVIKGLEYKMTLLDYGPR